MKIEKFKIRIKNILLLILAGILTGLAISAFKKSIPFVKNLSLQFLEESGLKFLIFYVAIWALICIFIKREKNIRGSGVADVIRIYNEELKTKWYKVLLYKFLAAVLAIGSGLTIGIEGPSVQMAASIGQGAGEIGNSNSEEKKNLLIGSAAAGMAVAFNAPIAAILFSIEKFYKTTNLKKIVSTAIAVFASVITSDILIAQKPEVLVSNISQISTTDLGHFIILGIFCGLSGRFINYAIAETENIYHKLKIDEYLKYLIPFIISYLFLVFDSRLFGSGDVFFDLDENNFIGKEFLYFYILKIFLLVIAISSGVPGGIFVPLLAIGILFGEVFGRAFIYFGIASENLMIVFVLASMCGHFSAIVKTPLTAIFLLWEITGGKIVYILPFAIVSIISYYISEID